jgi:hypothetical protein
MSSAAAEGRIIIYSDVRRGMSSIMNRPWLPTSGDDAVTVRGFIYNVDTGGLEEVRYPEPWGRSAKATAA